MQPPVNGGGLGSSHPEPRVSSSHRITCPTDSGRAGGECEIDAVESIRCLRCDRLLARAAYFRLEIKCPRCKTLSSYRATSPDRAIEPLSQERAAASGRDP